MNIVPTQQTRDIARAMMHTAQQESGADAALAHFEDVIWDQVPALIGILLGAISITSAATSAREHAMIIDGCLDCGRHDARHHGRGLCSTCYDHHKQAGTLYRYGAQRRRTEDTMADLAELQRQGLTNAQASRRLGMTPKALQKAIQRDRKRAAETMGPQPDAETARRRAMLAEAYRETAEGHVA